MIRFAWEPWERSVKEKCHLNPIRKSEVEFLKWEKGQCVLRRKSRHKERPEAKGVRLLRNGQLSSGAGTLGVWWEVRVEPTETGRERPRQQGTARAAQRCWA